MKNYFLIMSLLFIAACAHYPDVRPGQGGINTVKIQAEDKDTGYREAMNQAESFCSDKYKKSPVIIKENSTYKGNMSEEDYHAAKTASKVATAVGSTAYVFGGKKEHDAGGVIGLGGAVANDVIGKGYLYEMLFKCE